VPRTFGGRSTHTGVGAGFDGEVYKVVLARLSAAARAASALRHLQVGAGRRGVALPSPVTIDIERVEDRTHARNLPASRIAVTVVLLTFVVLSVGTSS